MGGGAALVERSSSLANVRTDGTLDVVHRLFYRCDELIGLRASPCTDDPLDFCVEVRIWIWPLGKLLSLQDVLDVSLDHDLQVGDFAEEFVSAGASALTNDDLNLDRGVAERSRLSQKVIRS